MANFLSIFISFLTTLFSVYFAFFVISFDIRICGAFILLAASSLSYFFLHSGILADSSIYRLNRDLTKYCLFFIPPLFCSSYIQQMNSFYSLMTLLITLGLFLSHFSMDTNKQDIVICLLASFCTVIIGYVCLKFYNISGLLGCLLATMAVVIANQNGEYNQSFYNDVYHILFFLSMVLLSKGAVPNLPLFSVW